MGNAGFNNPPYQRSYAVQWHTEKYRRDLTTNANCYIRSLETDGLIKHTVYPEVPPRVEYKLTQRGESLMPILKMLTDWALDHAEEIMKGRQK